MSANEPSHTGAHGELSVGWYWVTCWAAKSASALSMALLRGTEKAPCIHARQS